MIGYIVYPTYRIIDGKPHVHLFGRLKNGESFLAIIEARPYFYIKKSDSGNAKSTLDFDIEDSNLKDFKESSVLKVLATIPKDVPQLRRDFEDLGIDTYEADIRFAYRFLIDHSILSLVEIEGDYEKGEFVDRIYKEPKIQSAKEQEVKLKTLSFDIETDPKAKEIYSIAMVCGEYKDVFIVSHEKHNGATSFASEMELLQAFVNKVINLDPDIITGWNLVDFDMNVIRNRLKFYNIPFRIGRIDWDCRVTVQHDFFRSSSADIPGRVVLDGIELLKTSFISLDDYKLDTAAKVLLGKEKIDISNRSTNAAERVQILYNTDKEKLIEYNLHDALLVIEILEKKNILELTMQKTLITGLPLDKVKGSVAALDMLYLREASKEGYVCRTSRYSDREERVKGAFVMKPKFGIYDNVMVLDFKSLYPSIIRTYNIDPISFAKGGKIKAPNGATFSEEKGILPKIIERLAKKRDMAKKDLNNLQSFAIKIIMNSFYGVLANPSCRFYSLDMANAITAFAREIVQETAAKIDEMGFKPIYGDTDSVFVLSGAKDRKETYKIGDRIQNEIDDYYKKKVKKEYQRESYLDLEFEKLYETFMLPKIRGSEKGAKKRYAGLKINEDGSKEIDIKGLEFVRSDWTELAKHFQMSLLKLVFEKKDPGDYIKDLVENVRAGRMDDYLVYRKALRKAPEEYTKTTPPHVKAARKLDKIDSNIIRYYITENGPEPIQNTTSRIDYEHYIEKQLRPIADSILTLLGKNFDDYANKTTQKSLFEF